jgi:predicted nucleic acid-binding protein
VPSGKTVDILHVAIAVEAGADRFLTFDADQAALAKTEGLTVMP